MDFKNILEIGKISGISVIFSGLFTIFLKFYMDRKIEKLRTQYKKEYHVHELSFNKKFEIYQELWAKAINIQMAAAQLRPRADHLNPSETKEERKESRLKIVDKAIKEFRDIVYNKTPFYEQEIFDAAEEILKIVDKEGLEYIDYSPRSKGYWLNAKNNKKEIENLIDKLCAEIRKRIYSDI